MYAALLTWFIRRPDGGPVRTETCSLPFIKYDVPEVNCFINFVIKALPLQAWRSPEDSRNLRLPDFKKVVRFSAVCTGRLCHPGHIPGTHFCYRLSQPEDHRIMSMKNSNDTIGNQTRDLPVCSTAPRTTAPPRGSSIIQVCETKV
jgi:hypothetical protein